MSLHHQPEIDGLRALAVIPVVLFHAGVPIFGGGYVGVDIFFVISGYLITNILLDALRDERFSLLQFYERRIRRIFPALFTVLLVSACAAAWLLFPDELTDYGHSLFATSLFYANYHFMQGTGYFAAPAESKPLLHMWSLAVEEQFYLLFPLYLYVAWRWFRRWQLGLTLGLAMASLAYCAWLMGRMPDQAFYSAPARAWELMAGAALAMWPALPPRNQGLANAAAVAGLGAIVTSVALYSEATAFPGLMALPPVLGSVAIIYVAGAPGNFVGWLLAMAPLRWVGSISYSLYLWHWPVFVFYKAQAIEPLRAQDSALMVVLASLLAVLSWRFVERPFRTGWYSAGQTRIIMAGAALMIVGIASGAAIALGDGYPGRFPSQVNAILSAETDSPPKGSCQEIHQRGGAALNVCTIGAAQAKGPTFAVWGDSHAEALLPAIDAAARQHRLAGVHVVRGGCPALLSVRQTRDGYQDCDVSAEAFMAYLADHPNIHQVIMASRWALYAMGQRFRREPGHTVFITDKLTVHPSLEENRRVFERGLQRTLERLASMERQVVLVTQVPEAEWRVPLAMARAERLGRPIELAPRSVDYRARQAFVEKIIAQNMQQHPLLIVHPEQALCQRERCVVSTNGRPIYRDSNHLTASHALKLAPIFEPVFSQTALWPARYAP